MRQLDAQLLARWNVNELCRGRAFVAQLKMYRRLLGIGGIVASMRHQVCHRPVLGERQHSREQEC